MLKLKSNSIGSVSGKSAIGKEMVAFYQSLFSTGNPCISDDLEDLIELLILEEENVILTKVPNAEEIIATLQKLSSDKAPGPNGITVLFFKHFWEVVGLDVVKAMQDFFY